jgi:hypothetical protein
MKALDIGVTADEIALRVGRLVCATWQAEKQIRVLEARVDELEAQYEPAAPPDGDAHA